MWAKSGRFSEVKKDYIPGPGEYDVATPKKTRGGVSFGIGDRFKDRSAVDGGSITLESLLMAQQMDPKAALGRVQDTANKMFGKVRQSHCHSSCMTSAHPSRLCRA